MNGRQYYTYTKGNAQFFALDSTYMSPQQLSWIGHGVQVVFAGHEHAYERVKPQHGISYFVEGATGQLRKGNLRKGTGLTAGGYDQDLSFILVEIAGDAFNFQAVSRTGKRVDSGVILRARHRSRDAVPMTDALHDE